MGARSRRWLARAGLAVAIAGCASDPGASILAATEPPAPLVRLRPVSGADTTIALYVIDGARYPARDGTGARVPLPVICAANLVSVAVVRGEAARSAYGPGAESGVVVVQVKDQPELASRDGRATRRCG